MEQMAVVLILACDSLPEASLTYLISEHTHKKIWPCRDNISFDLLLIQLLRMLPLARAPMQSLLPYLLRNFHLVSLATYPLYQDPKTFLLIHPQGVGLKVLQILKQDSFCMKVSPAFQCRGDFLNLCIFLDSLHFRCLSAGGGISGLQTRVLFPTPFLVYHL